MSELTDEQQQLQRLSPTTLEAAIRHAINRFSAENGSDTPDFILAEYLIDCLAAYSMAVKSRDKWYGFEPWPHRSVSAPSELTRPGAQP